MRDLVLIVDDDESGRETIAMILEEEGYAVVSADSAADALEILRDLPVPAVILLDLWMPGMTGHQFLASLRSDPRFVRTPVILLSAERSSPMDDRRVVACLQKPCDLSTLLHAIQGAVTKPEPRTPTEL